MPCMVGYSIGPGTNEAYVAVAYDTGTTDTFYEGGSNSYNSPTNPTSSSHPNTDLVTHAVDYSALGNQAPSAPTSLEVNGQTDPSGLTSPTPTFSVVFNDASTTDTAIGYQIQVDNNSDFSSPYWDSGEQQLSSALSVGQTLPSVSYGGFALASSTTYYWRVRFIDNSNAVGAWSTSTATFSLAGPVAGGNVLQDISYTYDANGNITSIVDHSNNGAAKTVAFTYDDLNRLTSASTTAASSSPYRITYSYNKVGSITDNSNVGAYSYANTGNANPDAPTSVAGTAYTYDANGNLTQGENGNTYGYDYRNLMDSFSNGSVNVSYGYNANGNQVYAQTVNADGSSATTTYVGKYYQVGTNSNTNTWTTTTDNIWAGNTLLATVQKGTEVATSTNYVYPDQLNSVNVVADSSGNILQTLDYYPYGSKRISSGSSPVTRQYLSQQHDATNDLTNLNARYYNQRTGQFLSQDPVFLGDPNQQNLSDPQSLNPYSYVGDNPINNTDPFGKASLSQGQTSALANLYQQFNGADALQGVFKAFGGYQLWGELSGSVSSAFHGVVHGASSEFDQYASGINASLSNPVQAYSDITNGQVTFSRKIGIFIGGFGLAASFANPEDDAIQLSSRAKQISEVLDPIAQRKRTTAILRTAEGDIVASGGTDLTGAQMSSLGGQEVPAMPMPGAHAEVTALEHAANAGETPLVLSASRPICPSCQAYIESHGGTLLSAVSAFWQQ